MSWDAMMHRIIIKLNKQQHSFTLNKLNSAAAKQDLTNVCQAAIDYLLPRIISNKTSSSVSVRLLFLAGAAGTAPAVGGESLSVVGKLSWQACRAARNWCRHYITIIIN